MILAVQANPGEPGTGLLIVAALGVAAFVVGRVSRRFVSEVIAFIGIGILVGPQVLALVDEAAVAALEPVISLSLGAIVFMLGERLELPALRPLKESLPALALTENVLTFGLAMGVMMLAGTGVAAAYLLAAIALSTSPTTLLAVMGERRARGPLGDHLQAATALNNVSSAVLYGVGLPVVLATSGDSGPAEGALAFAQLIVASVVIGLLAAFALRQWGPAMHTGGERLLFVLVVLVATVAVSRWAGAPVVLSTLLAGAGLANISRDSKPLFASLRILEAPIFLAFFVVVGAGVHFDELATIGGLGVLYVLARGLGKLLGGWGGTALSRVGRSAGWGINAGWGLTPFAGMAIGLAAFTLEKAPEEIGGLVSAVVIGGVVVFELLAPLAVGRALDATGESGRAVQEDAEAQALAAAAPHRVERILFPISSPETARRKAPAVADLAASAGASLTALRVVLPWEEAAERDAPTLAIVEQCAASREVECETLVREHDNVLEAILEEVERQRADLIVIGESGVDDQGRRSPASADLVHELAERVPPGVQVMMLPTVLVGRRDRRVGSR